MSLSRSSSRSGGIHEPGCPQDLRASVAVGALFHGEPGAEIHLSLKDLAELTFHAGVVEDTPSSPGDKACQEVDVAIRSEVSPQGRPEDRQLGDLPLAAEGPHSLFGPVEPKANLQLVHHVVTLPPHCASIRNSPTRTEECFRIGNGLACGRLGVLRVFAKAPYSVPRPMAGFRPVGFRVAGRRRGGVVLEWCAAG